MTDLWLVSYIVLWLLVIVLCLITLGLLQQLGLLQHQLNQHTLEPVAEENPLLPLLEEDGPAIGSVLPQLKANSINGFGSLILSPLSSERDRLLLFLSPLCEPCQHIVESLNTLVKNDANTRKVIVIMRADEQACQAFISIFPLDLPVICDHERTITMDFNVHHAPFGLLYDVQGMLVSKGGIKNREDLLNLLGNGVQPHPLSL
jgi:methylamine dehydrogenase accessory protein MauD